MQGRASPVLAVPGWTRTRTKRQGPLALVSKVFPTEHEDFVLLLFKN